MEKIIENRDRYCEKHSQKYEEVDFKVWKCARCLLDERKKSAKKAYISGLITDLRIPDRFQESSFDNYQCKSTQQKNIVSRLTKYIKSYPEVGGIAMLGNIGTGKTHLAWTLCREICKKQSSCRITTVNRIIRGVRSSWSNSSKETEREIISGFTDYDLLVIDEIGSQYGTDSERIIINEIINDRYEMMKPTVIIGNLSVSEVKGILGARVYDRIIDNGEEMFFEWNSFRRALMQKHTKP